MLKEWQSDRINPLLVKLSQYFFTVDNKRILTFFTSTVGLVYAWGRVRPHAELGRDSARSPCTDLSNILSERMNMLLHHLLLIVPL